MGNCCCCKDSKDADPTVRAKEEKVYRTFFVYPGTNRAIDDPSRHLLWFFYDNPEAHPNEYIPSVSNTAIGNSQYITLQRRSWKTPEGVRKNADVICVFYEGTNRTVLYQGSQGVGRPPYFYIEVYDQLTGKATKKLYGMIATSFTPPSSPQRPPSRSQFGIGLTDNQKKYLKYAGYGLTGLATGAAVGLAGAHGKQKLNKYMRESYENNSKETNKSVRDRLERLEKRKVNNFGKKRSVKKVTHSLGSLRRDLKKVLKM